MKKNVFLMIGVGVMLCSGCVTLGKYEALESTNSHIRKEWNMTKQELSELQEELAEMQRQNQALNTDITDLNALRLDQEASIDSLSRSLEQLQQRYDTTMENYMQELSGKSRDLNRAQNLLTARTQELASREEDFRRREAQFMQQQTELQVRQEALEQREASTRASLAAKERELNEIQQAVSRALNGFEGKGLKVEQREGRVYVEMESKLMFASGSWTVSKEGAAAIRKIAQVLEKNPDLNIMVEGHTDNDAYKGAGNVKDNWDLSVMRATAIVKLLLKEGPQINPARVEACGHGAYAPKAENTTAAGKAQNRRTEIILIPRLEEIYNIVR